MHIATAQILRFFNYEHLNDVNARETSRMYSELASHMAFELPEDPETTVALRKLLESKDAAVRSVLRIEVPRV